MDASGMEFTGTEFSESNQFCGFGYPKNFHIMDIRFRSKLRRDRNWDGIRLVKQQRNGTLLFLFVLFSLLGFLGGN